MTTKENLNADIEELKADRDKCSDALDAIANIIDNVDDDGIMLRAIAKILKPLGK